MRTWKKVAIGALLAGAVCFAVGGVIGFYSGFMYGGNADRLGEGINTIVALRAFRAGKTNVALNELELHLDRNVAIFALMGGNRRPWFDVFDFGQRSAALSIKAYSDYRKQIPIQDAENKALIEKTMVTYDTILAEMGIPTTKDLH